MNEAELQETVISPITDQSLSIVVKTPDQYISADDFLREIKSGQKQVVGFFADMKAKAHAAWKAITSKEADLLKPLTAAEGAVKIKMLEFKRIQDQRAREERNRLQAKADAEAERKRKALQKRAEKLKTPELIEEAEQAAAEVIAPIVDVASTIPQTKGTVFKKTWKGFVVDKKEALLEASGNPVLAAMFEIDEGKLNKMAVAFKGELQFPGIEFREVETMAKGTQ